MSRMWIRYEKGEDAKYISHLDFLRAITRILKRAEIPVSYSQGFNPHQKLTFALALPLGTTGISELMEMETDREISPEELIEKLNANAPFGLKFIESGTSPDKSKFRHIRYAKYKVTPDVTLPDEDLADFLSKKEIMAEKKSKSGVKLTDIRKDIDSIKKEGESLIMVLSAGNDATLKVETVMTALKNSYPSFSFENYECVRTGILNENKNFI